MKPSLSKLTRILAALLIAMAALVPAALAAETPVVSIGARVTLEGTLPETTETFKLRMTADDAENPMPGGQSGGRYDLSVTGAGDAAFPDITFERAGVYTYTIAQLAGSDQDCAYDGRVYNLTVSIVNSEKGGLEAVVSMRQAGTADKKESAALFHNVYKTIVKPTTPPGTITETGVSDRGIYYAGGAALLLAAAFVIGYLLRRQESGHGK